MQNAIDYAIDFYRETVLQTLELDIETSGYNMLKGTQSLVIVIKFTTN